MPLKMLDLRLGFVAGSGTMATALYIVIQSRGRWWVDFEGESVGPFDTREQAALEGRSRAQGTMFDGRISEVLVPDSAGKYWIVWSSRAGGVASPQPVSTPRAKTAA